MEYQSCKIGFVVDDQAPAAAQSPSQFRPQALPPEDAYRAVLSGRWAPDQFKAWVQQVAQQRS